VAENRSKKYLFSSAERVDLVKELVKSWKNVSVALCNGLIVDFLKEQNIPILLRGVRGEVDFSYEFELSMMNRALNPGIETVFMTTAPEYFILRSSSIKELASFGGDVSAMVPLAVAEALKAKFK
jgi:pantetheine-phosphate adenylyltransferase